MFIRILNGSKSGSRKRNDKNKANLSAICSVFFFNFHYIFSRFSSSFFYFALLEDVLCLGRRVRGRFFVVVRKWTWTKFIFYIYFCHLETNLKCSIWFDYCLIQLYLPLIYYLNIPRSWQQQKKHRERITRKNIIRLVGTIFLLFFPRLSGKSLI